MRYITIDYKGVQANLDISINKERKELVNTVFVLLSELASFDENIVAFEEQCLFMSNEYLEWLVNELDSLKLKIDNGEFEINLEEE